MQGLSPNELEAINGGLPAVAPIVAGLSAGINLYVGVAQFIENMNYFTELRTSIVHATQVLNQFGAKLGEDLFNITHPQHAHKS